MTVTERALNRNFLSGTPASSIAASMASSRPYSASPQRSSISRQSTPSLPAKRPYSALSIENDDDDDPDIIPPPLRDSHSDITVISAAPTADATPTRRTEPLLSKQLARARFFDALETGNEFPGSTRNINGPDDLTKAELFKMFDILHACGKKTAAYEGENTLATARASMDNFLEAVFMDWTGKAELGRKPWIEIDAKSETIAGRICSHPNYHVNIASCIAAGTCTTEFAAMAHYTTSPTSCLKIEYTVVTSTPSTKPSANEPVIQADPSSICPLSRQDLRWEETDWAADLRAGLAMKITREVRKFNKFLAIWHARDLIGRWAKGSVSMGDGSEIGGFLGTEAVGLAVAGI